MSIGYDRVPLKPIAYPRRNEALFANTSDAGQANQEQVLTTMMADLQTLIAAQHRTNVDGFYRFLPAGARAHYAGGYAGMGSDLGSGQVELRLSSTGWDAGDAAEEALRAAGWLVRHSSPQPGLDKMVYRRGATECVSLDGARQLPQGLTMYTSHAVLTCTHTLASEHSGSARASLLYLLTDRLLPADLMSPYRGWWLHTDICLNQTLSLRMGDFLRNDNHLCNVM